MKFNMSLIKQIAASLGAVATAVNPGIGAVITGVVGATTKLDDMIQAARLEVERKEGETDAEYNARVTVEEQEAWNQISTDYLASRAAMLEAFKNHPGS